VQPPLAQRLERIAILRRPGAFVPQQHLARAVLLFGNDAFELAVVERMILGLHGEALVGRIEAGSLRYRPALQHAFELEAKVVVQPCRRVALDVIAQRLFFGRKLPSPRLGGEAEVAHLAIAPEPVGHAPTHSNVRARAR